MFPRCEYEEVWSDTRQVLTQCYWIIFDFFYFSFLCYDELQEERLGGEINFAMMSSDS